MEKQLEIDKLKLEKAQRELEEEKNALEKERIRIYTSEKSSRAESGIEMTPPDVSTYYFFSLLAAQSVFL